MHTLAATVLTAGKTALTDNQTGKQALNLARFHQALVWLSVSQRHRHTENLPYSTPHQPAQKRSRMAELTTYEDEMNINDLTIGQAKELAAMFANNAPTAPAIDCKMIGKYVIVRCRDAGVHAGFLESYNGRECVLTESRRLWYWKPADGQKYLSGLAVSGADDASKIGVALPRIFLTENCEIIECSQKAEESIRGAKADEN